MQEVDSRDIQNMESRGFQEIERESRYEEASENLASSESEGESEIQREDVVKKVARESWCVDKGSI